MKYLIITVSLFTSIFCSFAESVTEYEYREIEFKVDTIYIEQTFRNNIDHTVFGMIKAYDIYIGNRL